MCGIVGLISPKGYASEVIGSIVDTMGNTIEHRGPDDYGTFADNFCGMAIRRLAILDLTPGLYPFVSDDGNTVLIMNGEIYNYPQLKIQLENEGETFKTSCDSEAILKGFCKYGIDYIKNLRGMFALVIWQKKEKTLYLIRDRLGIKPIYYYQKNSDLFFASEAKALLALRGFGHKFELDDTAVHKMLGFMFYPNSSETVISGIKKVEAGTYLKISSEGLKKVVYWDLPDNTLDISFEDAQEQMEELLTESAQMHMLSDVPVGLMLSGGVDSALITALLAKKSGFSSLKTFTAHFEHEFNESELASQTAQKLNTEHHDIYIDTSKVNQNIEKYIKSYDSLDTFDGGLITTILLCEKIREAGVTVVLLGEGSDEVLGGYSWFGLSKFPFSYLPKSVRNRTYYYAISRNINNEFLKYSSFFDSMMQAESDKFKEISKAEIKLQLPNHLLMKVDKGSMASSIEARVPYLDHKFVEFVYKLKSSYKYRGNVPSLKNVNEKYILRKIAQKYLPPEVAWRKKKGFLLPMGEVLNQDLEKVKSYVLGGKFAKMHFGEQFTNSLFRDSSFSQINMQNEYFIWRLFLLEVWNQKVLSE